MNKYTKEHKKKRDVNPCIDCITLPICANRLRQNRAYNKEMKVESLTDKCIMIFQYVMYPKTLTDRAPMQLWFINEDRATHIYNYLTNSAYREQWR